MKTLSSATLAAFVGLLVPGANAAPSDLAAQIAQELPATLDLGCEATVGTAGDLLNMISAAAASDTATCLAVIDTVRGRLADATPEVRRRYATVDAAMGQVLGLCGHTAEARGALDEGLATVATLSKEIDPYLDPNFTPDGPITPEEICRVQAKALQIVGTSRILLNCEQTLRKTAVSDAERNELDAIAVQLKDRLETLKPAFAAMGLGDPTEGME